MLNNVYTASGMHMIHNENKTFIEFNGEVVAKNEKDATYKVHCALREYVSSLEVLSDIKVCLTPVSKVKQVIRNIVPDSIRVSIH